MNQKILLFLSLCLCSMSHLHAQVACTATSCPLALPEENIDSIRIEMGKQIRLIAEKYTRAELTIVITKVENKRFGYQILSDRNILLEENYIPAIAGEYGFINEEDAKKVAEFAVQRIKEGEMPPSITIDDLKRLQIKIE